MNGITIPYITGQIDYLEKNLQLLKQEVIKVTERPLPKKAAIYGSLPEIKLSFKDFKQVRKDLSTSWEHEWS